MSAVDIVGPVAGAQLGGEVEWGRALAPRHQGPAGRINRCQYRIIGDRRFQGMSVDVSICQWMLADVSRLLLCWFLSILVSRGTC